MLYYTPINYLHKTMYIEITVSWLFFILKTVLPLYPQSYVCQVVHIFLLLVHNVLQQAFSYSLKNTVNCKFSDYTQKLGDLKQSNKKSLPVKICFFTWNKFWTKDVKANIHLGKSKLTSANVNVTNNFCMTNALFPMRKSTRESLPIKNLN